MPVMRVREMRVVVDQWLVPMEVTVRLSGRIAWQVLMAMVLIVLMQMLVLDGGVSVLVRVALAEQEDHAECHSRHRDAIVPSERVAENGHRSKCSNERCRGKIRSLSRGADQAQGIGVEDNAHPVAETAEHERTSDVPA